MSDDLILLIRAVTLVFTIGYGILAALMIYSQWRYGRGICSRGARMPEEFKAPWKRSNGVREV